ncbi:hypothetical protein B0H63DRAFT_305671 [Podospora didyma]|uniref:Uncharacterized protein n=1 Tax=Podospora didyma TaxID=330526 RepID=A0AAE0N5C2_9PEZI|nr:hypothetical protein B0H63DRAFT_305671 [Podospora didyma]
MPSRKNPNQPSKNRIASIMGRTKKDNEKRAATAGMTRVQKADTRMGARSGLMPTSGPRAPLSKKKQKKVDQRLALALKRKEAEEGAIDLKGAGSKVEVKQLEA